MYFLNLLDQHAVGGQIHVHYKFAIGQFGDVGILAFELRHPFPVTLDAGQAQCLKLQLEATVHGFFRITEVGQMIFR